MVTPWPPQRNGIADYAYELAHHAGDDLRVVTQAANPSPARECHAVLTPAEFLAAPAERETVCVYHVGNNPDHAFLVPLFLRRPGIAVLHDTSLHDLALRVDAFLPGFYAAQMRAEPEEVARLLPRIEAVGWLREVDMRECRLLAWLRAAAGVIVHSEAARRVVARALPDAALHVVPHFCYTTGLGLPSLAAWRDAVRDPVRERWMQGMAFSGPAFVIVALGSPGVDKQLGSVVRAIARLAEPMRSQTVLLVAGALRHDDPDLLELAARHGCADRVRMLGWVPPAEVDRLLLVADLVMGLRFPTRGESSGAVARAMGLGCASVVIDHGAYAELPDASVIKLPARFDPTEALHGLFMALLADRSRIVRTREAAFAHAHESGDPATAAARYARIARSAARAA